MSLQDVVTEVRRDGDAKAQEIVANARKEAESLLAAAREKAQAHERSRMADAERESEQVLLQARSRAKSEAGKVVLMAEAELREQLRQSVLAGFSDLDATTRTGHINALLKRAEAIVPKGRVWGAEQDKAALDAQTTYEVAGATDILGGIIVESDDGTARLDLSYETLLSDMWRDVLRSEAKLFA